MGPGPFLRLVGMDPDAGVNPVIFLGERKRRVQFLRTRARAYRQQRANARSTRPFEHGFAVIGKLREVNMPVGVNQVHGTAYFSRAPSSTSSWKPASTGRPSGPTEAATIIPFDSTARNFLCARIVMT